MARILRIGGLDGLNAAPLQWGLARHRGTGPSSIHLTLRTPAGSAAALATGQADVALIPSIEVQRIPGVRIVEGISIAARRQVRSVILLTRGDPAALRHVALDQTSRTSVALLRVLLQNLFGVRPRFTTQPPDPTVMMEHCDGALLIADAALQAETDGWRVHDLAALWAGWTGLPFVFAVWAVAPGIHEPAIAGLLSRSRTEGLENLPLLVAREAARNKNPGRAILTAYLSELLHYTLGPREVASLERFFVEAQALDLIPERQPLRFYRRAEPGKRAAAGGAA
ncbi:MAG: menaquinone biosynthetic enzyme MqnA/MqnD family protein [Acidobacteriota bacterium]